MKDIKDNVISLFGNKEVTQNEGVKYSELIEQFITPFEKEFLNDWYFEDIFEFAINAWNLGNLKIIMPKKEFEEVFSSTPEHNIDIRLLKKMMKHKETNFKKYNRFIADFEIKEVHGNPTLTVLTEEAESYLQKMMDGFSNETTPHDFEENYINRNAIILKPKQPLFDWLNSLYPDDQITEIEETNMYLINDEIYDVNKWLKKNFDKFFMMELDEWHTNKKDWPQQRNYNMFTQWFQMDYSTMVYDLEREPIIKD